MIHEVSFGIYFLNAIGTYLQNNWMDDTTFSHNLFLTSHSGRISIEEPVQSKINFWPRRIYPVLFLQRMKNTFLRFCWNNLLWFRVTFSQNTDNAIYSCNFLSYCKTLFDAPHLPKSESKTDFRQGLWLIRNMWSFYLYVQKVSEQFSYGF